MRPDNRSPPKEGKLYRSCCAAAHTDEGLIGIENRSAGGKINTNVSREVFAISRKSEGAHKQCARSIEANVVPGAIDPDGTA